MPYSSIITGDIRVPDADIVDYNAHILTEQSLRHGQYPVVALALPHNPCVAQMIGFERLSSAMHVQAHLLTGDFPCR